MNQQDHSLFEEGLTPEFISDLRCRIGALLLPSAEKYFAPGGTAYTQNAPNLKRGEMAVNYFDYQPCAVSVLGSLASQGDRQADILVRRIFDNAAYYLDEWRSREGFNTSLRRSQLHLVLAYESLKTLIDPGLALRWRALLLRSAQDMMEHFNHFEEKHPALDNRGFGTGINHVAIAAEGIWKTGEALGQEDLCTKSGDFVDRLVEYGHPDGYFEEHTNDRREGGPSLVYTPLTAGCAYIVQKWRGVANTDRFSACGALFRNLCDSHLRTMPFADERANPHGLGPYGIALHALSPEGRGFLRKALNPDTNLNLTSNASLEYLSRIYFELGESESGGGAVPEPFSEGTFRLTLPLGVIRKNKWHAGVSGLHALNRDISPDSDYSLDRQTLCFLSHDVANTILSGVKSKRDPDWSTLRLGDDAYPVRTGELSNAFVATAHYAEFSATIEWDLQEQARLTMTTDSPKTICAQLILEIGQGDQIELNDQPVELADEPFKRSDVTTVATKSWSLNSPLSGNLDWFVAPFNPYSEANKSAPQTRRPVFRVEFTGQVTIEFKII
ncbi:MAG: hypothetical protein VX910_09780 [Candidatus Latescibacterota bacterium]|nr:hypothetical protein [Candidatus Latescibacterota bacterium]